MQLKKDDCGGFFLHFLLFHFTFSFFPMFSSFHSSLFIRHFFMSLQPQQEYSEVSPIIEAKYLLSNGRRARAFAVLKKGAESGNVMACYDAGFMMIQGIGCDKDLRGGLELMSKGTKLEEGSEGLSWKLCGSATELTEPQSMFIGGEFSLMYLILNDDLDDHISSHFHHSILNSHIDECK